MKVKRTILFSASVVIISTFTACESTITESPSISVDGEQYRVRTVEESDYLGNIGVIPESWEEVFIPGMGWVDCHGDCGRMVTQELSESSQPTTRTPTFEPSQTQGGGH